MGRVLIPHARVVVALNSARKYLAHHPVKGYEQVKTNYICYAVDRAWKAGDITFTEARTVKSIIMDRLGNDAYTLVVWLNNQGIYGTNYQYQKHRHDWLDLLIEEFSHGNKITKTT